MNRASTAPTAVAPTGVPRSARVRARALLAPGVVALTALLGAGWIFARDPEHGPSLLLCPFHAVTGLDCPGCGMTRGVHDLLHGDVIAALDHNLLLLVAVPAAVIAYAAWVRRSWTGVGTRVVLSGRLVGVLLVLGVTFWVVRNLPGVPYLPAA